MSKFISLPFQGGATTLPTAGAVTVSGGVITAIADGTSQGVALTSAPIVTITSTDWLGSGAVYVVKTLVGGAIPSSGFVKISGGSGYTSASTVVVNLTWPPVLIDVDRISCIGPDTPGATAGTNIVNLYLGNGASKIALTFKSALSADSNVDIRSWLVQQIVLCASVKQLKPTIPYSQVPNIGTVPEFSLPNGVVLNSYSLS